MQIRSDKVLSLNQEDKKTFLDKCREINCVNGEMIDLKKYAEYYCEIDCKMTSKLVEEISEFMAKQLNMHGFGPVSH